MLNQTRPKRGLHGRTVRKYERQCVSCGWQTPDGLRTLIHVHHVIPISAGGDDTTENMVVLCPNCHAIAHAVTQRSNTLKDYTGPTTTPQLLALIALARHGDGGRWVAESRLAIVRPLVESLRRPV